MNCPSQLVITGGAACGKSYAVDFLLQTLGKQIARFDADQVVHELYQKRENAQALTERFGAQLFDDSGKLKRQQLLSIILDKPEEKQWLEDFIHPQVAQAREQLVEHIGHHQPEIRWIIAEIPLWFEKQVAWKADLSCLIGANHLIQISRLTRERGLSQSQAEALLELQWPSERKSPQADVVCWNDGSQEAFRWQLERFCSHYLYD